MNDLLNNPNLTAYALGELEGQEALDMKNQIEKNPEAKKYVDEIQSAAREIETDLAGEDVPRLTVAERGEIYEGAGVEAPVPRKSWLATLAWSGGSAAVLLLLAAIMVPNFQRFSGKSSPERIAMMQKRQQEREVLLAESMVAKEASQRTRPGSAPLMDLNAKNELYQAKSYGAVAGSGGQMIGFHPDHAHNTESYKPINDNAFKSVSNDPLSTFSIDVDTASYANMRRFLASGQLPPPDAVRIEEMLNYFKYNYPNPDKGQPFSVSTEAMRAPWNNKHALVRIGLKGYETPMAERKAANLVFLIDVSGSMNSPEKLPLVQLSLKMLTEQLRPQDRVAIVTYAGNSGLVLPSTSGANKSQIIAAIDGLQSGGSTNGASGIELAYQVAQANFIGGGVNRVILATDGDFNVGVTSEGDLQRTIEKKAKSGVFLSVLGFGTGNYKDSMMQTLANKGNGNHAYIDTIREARKVLVQQAGGTLNAIAKDVKIQVEFNPQYVSSYRLIGYEKRMLNKEDFNDDSKDAGEIGEGHTVTALYEVVPTGVKMETPSVDVLKYQKATPTAPTGKANDEIMTVKVRYKQPEGDKSKLIETPVKNDFREIEKASGDMKFAAGVAAFGMILRESEHRGSITLQDVLSLTAPQRRDDEYRSEFVELVKQAQSLRGAQSEPSKGSIGVDEIPPGFKFKGN